MQGCETGCKYFSGGEIKHHKDCKYYPESFSKMYDELEKKYELLVSRVDAVVKVNFADLADEVKQDIENRIIKGVQTYGERLKINNGRNALLDAYEEILDLALYIKQELKEKESKISA